MTTNIPNNSEKALEIINNGKVMGLRMIASQLNLSPLETAQLLPPEMSLVLSGDNFEQVWHGLTKVGKLTLIVTHDSHVFEIPTTVVEGKIGMGYYNIFSGDQPLHGHIAYQDIKHIAFLSIPFMGKESHCVTFFNANGSDSFSFYVGRENHKLIPEVVTAFKALKAELIA